MAASANQILIRQEGSRLDVEPIANFDGENFVIHRVGDQVRKLARFRNGVQLENLPDGSLLLSFPASVKNDRNELGVKPERVEVSDGPESFCPHVESHDPLVEFDPVDDARFVEDLKEFVRRGHQIPRVAKEMFRLHVWQTMP